MLKLGLFSKLAVIAVIIWAFASALPNVLTDTQRAILPNMFPQETLNLGLDLQGGSHLVLQIDMQAVKQRALENLEDEIRQDLRNAEIGYINLNTAGDGVSFQVIDITQTENASKALYRPGERNIEVNDLIVYVNLTEDQIQNLTQTAVAQTVQVLRTRVDAFGVAEPVIQRQGLDRVIVELPGIDDVARAKAVIGKTAQLTFHVVDGSADPMGRIPAGRQVLYEESAQGVKYPVVMYKRPALTGEMLISADSGFDQYSQPSVNIAFNSRGTRIFGKLSTEYVNQRFAIVLDGKVLSAPVFREPILGGRAQITGNFTVQEAQDLSTLLNAGALPAPVNVVEERTVGPSLGADAVAAGKLAIVIGFMLVLVCMPLVYGLFGIAAGVALLVNLVAVIAIMTYVGFTLTLPGMAGIVLTIGMAVDANVLIFERIREELQGKAKILSALENGFQGAFGTILDANITTLLAAVILFFMGSGPVQGFALTLAIGIVSSMFTAIMLTRWIIVAYVQAVKPKTLKV